MPISAVVADTPYYVLMDKNRRVGPRVVESHSSTECSPIYGFSVKRAYDTFCSNSPLALKPYPLVKTYLQDRVGAPGGGLQLVVVDAIGPSEPYLHAATVEHVLEAQEDRTTHVTAAYRLTLDQEADAYRLDEDSV